MLNCVYQLTAPRRFEMLVRNEDITADGLVVRPTHLSICNADQRYFQGTRSGEVLKEKLPMALIHEAIGTVIFDTSGSFLPGTTVAMIPNLPQENNEFIAENYLRSSKFRGSSADGFMQEFVSTTPNRVVPVSENTTPEVAAFTELVSVMVHVISRFNNIANQDRKTIAFWGDGNLGYIGSLLFKKLYPSSKVIIVGRNEYKLADFTFADETYLTSDLPSNFQINHAFECVGGLGAESAIEQIIDAILPEGTIALCGVSENPVPINTRMVLEKGLRLFGSSRSGRADFEKVFSLYREVPELTSYLEGIVGQTFCVRSINDIEAAFEADVKKRLGKTIMRWEI